MYVYIVRHGETDYNAKKERFGGRVDVPLNNNGREQAMKLKIRYAGITFDRVYSSPLIRTIETARIISDCDIIIDERLIERSNGDLEGRLRSEIDPATIDYSNIEFIMKYHIEPDESIKGRVRSFLNEIANLEGCENILVVTHAGTAMYMSHYLDGEPEDKKVSEYKLENGKDEVYSVEKGKKFVKIIPTPNRCR